MAGRLSDLTRALTNKQPVAIGSYERSAEELKWAIDRNYIHIKFIKARFEMGVQLIQSQCEYGNGDFEKASGKIHLVGALILKYDKVKLVADIDLATCEGTGYLIPLNDEEWDKIWED